MESNEQPTPGGNLSDDDQTLMQIGDQPTPGGPEELQFSSEYDAVYIERPPPPVPPSQYVQASHSFHSFPPPRPRYSPDTQFARPMSQPPSFPQISPQYSWQGYHGGHASYSHSYPPQSHHHAPQSHHQSPQSHHHPPQSHHHPPQSHHHPPQTHHRHSQSRSHSEIPPPPGMFTSYELAKEETYRLHEHSPQRNDHTERHPQFQNEEHRRRRSINRREEEEEIVEEFGYFNPLYAPRLRWSENKEPEFGFEFPNPFSTMVSSSVPLIHLNNFLVFFFVFFFFEISDGLDFEPLFKRVKKMIRSWNGKSRPWDSPEGRLLYQEWKTLQTSPQQRELVRSWLVENQKIDDYGFKLWEDMLFGGPINGVPLSSTHLERKKERRKFDMLMFQIIKLLYQKAKNRQVCPTNVKF